MFYVSKVIGFVCAARVHCLRVVRKASVVLCKPILTNIFRIETMKGKFMQAQVGGRL